MSAPSPRTAPADQSPASCAPPPRSGLRRPRSAAGGAPVTAPAQPVSSARPIHSVLCEERRIPVPRPCVHELVAASLRRQIVDGVLGPGTYLPNPTRLASDVGVGGTTVRRAPGLCAKSGYRAPPRVRPPP
ncbi:GntR family transcriptional regulator [Streptomyces sp. NPDC057654]|uniref:GntR family transcriptional regulator n=1 Tax=Streptomyces sp. NPDC057654 TaxID=3346196 RepID=UPI0036CA074C